MRYLPIARIIPMPGKTYEMPGFHGRRGAMIAWPLIVGAAAATGVAVAVAAKLVGWRDRLVLGAAAGSFFAVVLWRAIANGARLNGDFALLVSAADCGCLIAGGLAPALLAVCRLKAAAPRCRLSPEASRHSSPTSQFCDPGPAARG
jgi:hypothetical protein